ncbi:hypothetical protein NEMBOFW57_004977 [Staphylotrichum longicolle]|uniref:Uncharacterized protein n=1 Tax=Staphylotrichum longicolle TaxID=669026 RepID=A0AAD4F0H5_9PEZI|nr:hypothetical protein NEMBOFW57_004977 [Staphylotrichum longicolle]
MDDGLVNINMTYIDPNLQSPSPTPYGNIWAAPPQQPLKATSKTAFFAGDPSRQATHHTPVRPALGIPPVPSSSHTRFTSPVSSIQPLSSGSALSPQADTESYYDNLPRTPPDTVLLSPFQTQLPLDPFSNAHAVQFVSMGPACVSPREVNSSQQSEYFETDNDIVDFNFAPGCSFDSHTSHCDAEPMQSTMGSDFAVQQAGHPQMQSMVKDEIEVSSQYPPLKEEDAGSDDEILVKRMAEDDDADGDYKPNKRPKHKTNARASARRNLKTATASPPRSRRSRGANPASASHSLPAPTSSTSRAPLTCPRCQQPNFSSQPDLDAHIQRQHLRPFNCVFDFAGCDTTFAKKNEWKRHVMTQHLLLNYWLCTEGACADAHPDATTTTAAANPPPAGAIFNRKDLFTQHLKRMHAPKQVKDIVRVANTTNNSPTGTGGKKPTAKSSSGMKPPPSQAQADWEARIRHLQDTAIHPRCALPDLMRCPVPGCSASAFRGPDAWDQRMEHVAKHMERAATAAASSHSQKERGAGGSGSGRVVFGGPGDNTLVEWASRPEVGIIEPREGGAEGEWLLKGQQTRRAKGGEKVGEVDEEEDDEEEDAEGEEDD